MSHGPSPPRAHLLHGQPLFQSAAKSKSRCEPMKTPLPSATRIRNLLFCLAVFLAAVRPAAAEWITLQIPLTMADRPFTFWEEGSDGGTILPLAVPADQLGYHLGDYSLRTSGVPILMGGFFDANGMWHPDGSSYATISAFRQGTGMFFLRDEITNQLSPPDQTALLYADWRTLDGGAPLIFIAVGEDRHSHLLAFVSANGFIPLTNGSIQMGVGSDGQLQSLGFFNAWGTGINPVTTWDETVAVVDLTAEEAAAGNPNLTGATWAADPTAYSVKPLTLVFANIELGREFDVYAGGSATRVQAVANPGSGQIEGSTSVSIGAGIDFRVVRLGSGGLADGESQWHQMPLSAHTFHVSADMPLSASDPVVMTVHFRVDPALNPWGMSVYSYATYTSTPLTVNGWQSSGSFYGGNGWVQMDYYDCWAEIDTRDGYTVFNSVPSDLGAGPDFMVWPPTPPQSVLSIALPAQRRGNAIVSSQGLALTLTSHGVPSNISDSFTGQPYPVAHDTYELSITDFETSTITLTDEATGDTSYAWSLIATGSISGTWGGWYPTSPLLLRISGTRWRNQLQVRCADGTVFPISIHRIQGDWSVVPGTTQSWFNPYGFFDATTMCVAGIPWHLYDVTRGQYLNADGGDPASFIAATDSTDSDGDGLANWYEVLIGTNPTNPNTDGDTQGNDGYEVAHGTNPLAKPVTAIGNTLKVFTPLEP